MSEVTLDGETFDLSDPAQQESYWTKYAAKYLVGKRIASVRYMSEQEAEQMGWLHRPVVIQLNDGSIFFASRDDEGNDAGAIFGQTRNEDQVTLPVLR